MVSESRFLGFYKERLLSVPHLAILYSILGENLLKHRPSLVPCLSFCKESIYMDSLGNKIVKDRLTEGARETETGEERWGEKQRARRR